MIDIEALPQTVKRRVVFYIPGFDPMPPNRYRELYRSEAKKQAEISNYDIEANRISTLNGMSRFAVDANINGQDVHSEVRFMQWNDLVHREMQESILKAWLSMIKVAKVIGFSGALSRLLKLHFPPNIAGIYPFLMIPFQILSSIFLAISICQPMAGLSFTGAPILATILGIAIFWIAVNIWRHLDGYLMPYYMLHDLSFICQEEGYTPKQLRARLEEFKSAMADAAQEDWDEILLVGHSSGAHLGVIILAELIREGKITPQHNVSFLTLGHAIPMVSYLPKAHDLRLALFELSDQDVVKWVDFSAPSDGASFSLHNPVTSSVEAEPDCPQPRVLSAAFRQSLSDAYYRSLRMRFFRLHFQYLCHFDRPGIYDYFRVTAGPIRLWERYGSLKNTPSLLSGNFNKFLDQALNAGAQMKRLPAKPRSPQTGWSRWRRLFAYRDDMFIALPQKLYSAKMAQVRTPFFSSFLINDLDVQKHILESPADRFPKSPAIYGSLHALLRESIFVTNGDDWAFQRRVIDPAFKGGRIKIAYPSMQDAAQSFITRLKKLADGNLVEMEFECSFFAADVIFRTMFSKPIEHHLAQEIFENFQIYQRAQPVWNMPNVLRLPAWVPRFYSRKGQRAANKIHQAIGALVDERVLEIQNQTAPDDLVTNILTQTDPQTGEKLNRTQAIGNIATFFIAGHETSATALAWSLYLLALRPDEQSKLAEELREVDVNAIPFAQLQKLTQTRNIIFETLRLYPPVPMLVREATEQEIFRGRDVEPQDWCITSPWYSGRHPDFWEEADDFMPARWNDLPQHCREAYFPFSKGPRICTGVGFAQTELLLALAQLGKNFEVTLGDEEPIPVAHLTVRALNGVYLRLNLRQ